MRTTVRLSESLLAEAKKYAAESGGTLTSVLEDALREALARRRAPAKHKAIRLRTINGDGVRPGVDLDDTAALLELMES
jgi:hypothetical protein